MVNKRTVRNALELAVNLTSALMNAQADIAFALGDDDLEHIDAINEQVWDCALAVEDRPARVRRARINNFTDELLELVKPAASPLAIVK